MRTEEALSATGAGLWTWDNATGLVTLDARAAHLVGITTGPGTAGPGAPGGTGVPGVPGGTADVTIQANAVRSHLHAVDYVTFQGIITLALSEHAPAEAPLRVVDRDGKVVRTVRTLARPLRTTPAEISGPGSPEAMTRIVGLLYEVPEPVGAALDEEAAAGPSAPAHAAASPSAPSDWDWRRNREAFLLDAGRALSEAYTTADVLRVAASLAMPGFAPDVLTVYALEGDRLRPLGREATERAERSVRADRDHPVAETGRTGRALYLCDPDEYARRFPGEGGGAGTGGGSGEGAGGASGERSGGASGERSGEASGERSGEGVRGGPEPYSRAYLPLIVAGSVIGVWAVGFARPVAFTPDERAVLTTLTRMLAQALSRVTLNESERELSAGLQRTMRPARKPVIPGMELAARYIPTGGGLQVGGDWYDVIPLPSGRTALVIGDVQGHDVRAAAIMGQLRIALRAYASEGHHPDAVLARASRFLYGMSGAASLRELGPGAAGADAGPGTGAGASGGPAGENGAPSGATTALTGPESPGDAEAEADHARFATCLYIEVDPTTGTLDIARAGHPDPAVQMPGGPMLVRPTAGGLPLGIDPDSDYPTTRLVLQPGERLLMCTDGLIETGGHDLETGWTRIREVVEEHDGSAASPDSAGSVPGSEPGADGLEGLADSLVEGVLGPRGARLPGPLVDRHSSHADDIALLLLAPGPGRAGTARGGTSVSSRRSVLTIAQAEPDRIAEARRELRDLLHDWGDEDQADGAVLMLSEMLTNVLVHTDGDALFVAEIKGPQDGRKLRVQVLDHSDELPHRRSPGEMASSGRGLLLMEMLADRWGVDPRGEGKCIWFEIRERQEGEDPPPGRNPDVDPALGEALASELLGGDPA